MEIDGLGVRQGRIHLQSKPGAAPCEAHPPVMCVWACSLYIIMAIL